MRKITGLRSGGKVFGTFHGELVYLADVSDEQLYMYKFILEKCQDVMPTFPNHFIFI